MITSTNSETGAFRRNNPIRVASMESRNIWPEADTMFISVGTGSAPGKSLLGNLKELAQRLSEIALDTEQTNKDFRAENPDLIRNGRCTYNSFDIHLNGPIILVLNHGFRVNGLRCSVPGVSLLERKILISKTVFSVSIQRERWEFGKHRHRRVSSSSRDSCLH